MGRLELPTPGPPDQYSNRTELHPDEGMGVGVGCVFRKPAANIGIMVQILKSFFAQVSFRIDGCHTARAGSRYRLAVVGILHVAAGKDAFHARL